MNATFSKIIQFNAVILVKKLFNSYKTQNYFIEQRPDYFFANVQLEKHFQLKAA